MPKGDKYIELTRFLEESNEEEISLTFDEIESIIGGNIPPSVKTKPNQLIPSALYSFAYGWINAGYMIIDSDLNEQKITLKKNK